MFLFVFIKEREISTPIFDTLFCQTMLIPYYDLPHFSITIVYCGIVITRPRIYYSLNIIVKLVSFLIASHEIEGITH